MAPCEDHRGTFTVYTIPQYDKIDAPGFYARELRSHQICSLKATDAFHKTSRKFKLQNYRSFFLLLFIYFARTNNYNTLHLQFITGNCYRLQKRKKKEKQSPQKYYSLYINNYEKAADPTEILLS